MRSIDIINKYYYNKNMETTDSMEKEPFISIIMVCYNYAHLLHRAFDAIASQTFRDFELVFVDNGCTDNSAQMVQDFATAHPDIKVRIVTIEKNIGPAHGYDTGAWSAVGKYLMFHDADDWMDNNTLELLAASAKENDADRVIGSYRHIDNNGKLLRVIQFSDDIVFWNYYQLHANLFRRSVYHDNNIKLPLSVGWPDGYMAMAFSPYIKKCNCVSTPIYNCLVSVKSTSRNKNTYKILWTDELSFDNVAKHWADIYSYVDDPGDKVWIEYSAVKVYYSYMLSYLRDAPIREISINYNKLHEVMKKYFPNYLKNNKISIFRKGGDRFYSKAIIKISSICEYLCLMKFVLMCYHLIWKVYNFND